MLNSVGRQKEKITIRLGGSSTGHGVDTRRAVDDSTSHDVIVTGCHWMMFFRWFNIGRPKTSIFSMSSSSPNRK